MKKNRAANWPQLGKDSFDDMISVEESVEEPFFDDIPPWVDNAVTELVFKATPTVKSSSSRQTGPQVLGALIGHQEWLFEYYSSDELYTEEQAGKIWQATEEIFRAKCKTLEPEQLTQAMKDFDQLIQRSQHLAESYEKISELKKPVFKRCFDRANEQATTKEKVEFLKAYTKARQITVIKPPEQTAPRVKMLTVMSFGWRDVLKIKNRSVLRQALVRLFNGLGIYNSDFVNGVCRDIKLKLAKRGAPKK